MSTLSPEDALRLNVLLSSGPRALRIDESTMTVYGLGERGETRVVLNPNSRDDQYLRRVRELISGDVLGSPGGYPVYLRRWTRMGQARDESLEQLLLLGEPEAVVAVVHAPGLTDEYARRAWWALPTAENARRMLERDVVVRGTMGPVLAAFLAEYLPFETEPADMIDSVRLILQPGLIHEDTRNSIWRKARNRSAYLLGFLMAVPDDLPERSPRRHDFDEHAGVLSGLAAAGNALAATTARVLDAPGQTYLRACLQALQRPANQDVVNTLLNTVAEYFAAFRPERGDDVELARIQQEARDLCAAGGSPALRALLDARPQLADEIRAMVVLSRLGYGVVRPIFSRTTAIGSLMRRKLEPVASPLAAELALLLGT